MNKVILIGRLTRDPELRYTESNMPICRFGIAVNRTFSNQNGEREADFINISVFGKQAENVKNYLAKGSQVAVEGRIQVRNYDDQNGQKRSQVAIDGRIQTSSYEKDGVRRYNTDVVANNVQFLDTKNSGNAGGNDNFEFDNVSPSDFSSSMSTTAVKNDPFADFGASIEINDDELPF